MLINAECTPGKYRPPGGSLVADAGFLLEVAGTARSHTADGTGDALLSVGGNR